MRRTAAVLSLLVLLAGCSSGSVDTASSGDAGDAGGAMAAAPDAHVKEASLPRVAPLPRSVVRTAELHVVVVDVRAAADRAEDLVRAAVGEVGSEDLDLAVEQPTADLLLLVPAAGLDPMLDRLAALGTQQSRKLASEDVTEQVVDLESRLATQRRSVARVRDLLARASSLSDVVRLEGELSKRQADLESLQARLRALSGQVALSRVTLRLTTATETAVAADVGFRSGLRGGWSALLATARIGAATVGALLPFLPLLAIGGFVAWRMRRRAATA